MILSVINIRINTKVKQKVKIMTIFEEYVLPLQTDLNKCQLYE